MKRQLRSFQTWFPFLRPAKFNFFNLVTKNFGIKIDQDFRSLTYLKPVNLAIDIGGNWGQSIHALKYCASPKNVVSFEPNPILSSWLEREFAGDQSVEIQSCALSDKDGSFDLYIPRYRNYIYDGLASLDKAEATNWLNHRTLARFDHKKLFVDRVRVTTKKLDDFNLSPDIVKIDVQGVEEQVFGGGYETFKRCSPATIVEAPSPALKDNFRSIGMKPYFFNGKTLAPHRGQWKNTLFLSQNHLERISSGLKNSGS